MAAELIPKFYKSRGPWTSEEDPWTTLTDVNGYAYMLNRETGETAECPTNEQPGEAEAPALDENGEVIYQL
jgi:hypothetical protein